jgi:hypothetical protein
MAINENGTSEPLRSSAPITAQLPFSMLKNFYLNNKSRSRVYNRTTWCIRTTGNQ